MNKLSLILANIALVGALQTHAETKIDFAKDIRPILEKNCFECHGADKQKAKLRFDTEKFLSDEMIVAAKDASKSELFIRISLPPGHDDIMPPEGDPLPKEQIDLIRDWINQGAAWSEAPALAETPGKVNFSTDIAPILQQTCVECHGPDKARGKLRLDAQEFVLKGDSDHDVILPGNPDASELIRRVTLPADDDDVMPPKGDSLTAAQIELLRKWISEGAEWPEGFVVKGPEGPASIFDKLVAVEPSETENKAISDLQSMGIAVRPIAMNVNWREANLRLQAPEAAGKALNHIKDIPNLVQLNLAATQVTDEDLKLIASLPNLTHLHLENTAITDAGLQHLKNLKNLVYLNLYGTPVTDAGLKHLEGLTELKNLYLWQTEVTDSGAAELQQALPNVNINRGLDLAVSIEAEEEKEAEEEEKKE
jgi:mono/diheme cytochrome c family protein